MSLLAMIHFLRLVTPVIPRKIQESNRSSHIWKKRIFLLMAYGLLRIKALSYVRRLPVFSEYLVSIRTYWRDSKISSTCENGSLSIKMLSRNTVLMPFLCLVWIMLISFLEISPSSSSELRASENHSSMSSITKQKWTPVSHAMDWLPWLSSRILNELI